MGDIESPPRYEDLNFNNHNIQPFSKDDMPVIIMNSLGIVDQLILILSILLLLSNLVPVLTYYQLIYFFGFIFIGLFFLVSRKNKERVLSGKYITELTFFLIIGLSYLLTLFLFVNSVLNTLNLVFYFIHENSSEISSSSTYSNVRYFLIGYAVLIFYFSVEFIILIVMILCRKDFKTHTILKSSMVRFKVSAALIFAINIYFFYKMKKILIFLVLTSIYDVVSTIISYIYGLKYLIDKKTKTDFYAHLLLKQIIFSIIYVTLILDFIVTNMSYIPYLDLRLFNYKIFSNLTY
ncbi:hypothetical protein TUBRATIS_13760 [Tubulinosema ratisbonensis]|uniref:Uncharacterized protein n=1 Tax=Tubulinosema ratisbonensis TaxID=291195 RepID=A0A437ALP8_9MICR|nr:hypothetical protein TUBRATIS_13760 [Tubulinosema ratisbonensis]